MTLKTLAFAGKSDTAAGTVPAFDTGEPWSAPNPVYVPNADAAKPRVSSGVLKMAPASNAVHGFYLQRNAGARVTKVGCKFKYALNSQNMGADSGICLALPSAALPAGLAGALPNANCHCGVSSKYWRYDIVTTSVLTLQTNGFVFALDRKNGTEYTAEVVIGPTDTATLSVRQGATELINPKPVIKNPQLATLGGNWVFWEVRNGAGNADSPVELTEIWYDTVAASAPPAPPAPDPFAAFWGWWWSLI